MLHLKLIVIFTLLYYAASSKILGIFPIQSKSHQSLHETITKGLATRDHEVTVLSHFKGTENLPNHTNIVLNKSVSSFVDSIAIEDAWKMDKFWQNLPIQEELENLCCQGVLDSETIKELIRSTEKRIDLIIIEVYDTLCYNLLAHVLDVPLIIVLPPSIAPGTDYFAGNPHNPSHVPLVRTPFTTRMNFWQRLDNTIKYTTLYWYRIYINRRNVEKIAQKYFNIEMPPDEILLKRTALVLYNNHFSMIARPKSPNVIDIGGIHIKPAKKLPTDLEEFIEQSPNGVILFTFGTTIKASSISADKIRFILEVFSNIPQRVLWRVDDLGFIDAVPSNVKLFKWLPQRDILEHPNVIALISHGGISGIFEAIHTATPIIGIPFWFDQFHNVNLLVEKGVAINIDYYTMTADSFASAIQTIGSPKYRENMRQLSKQFKDRSRSPLDEAIYWIEYVLKYQGAPHLRSAAADMPLYQYLLLDVFGFLLLITVGILLIGKYSLKCIIHLLYASKKINKLE